MEVKTVLAIDPGASKCGMALVQRDGDGNLQLLWRKVSPRAAVVANIEEASEVQAFSVLIIGSGTTSKSLLEIIRQAFPSVGILVVDEKDTTMQARERYWEHVQRRGWRKLMPASFQVPPEAFDDFVAMILAERVLHAG